MKDTLQFHKKTGLSANTLKLLAIIFMLLDHLWATIIPGNKWMNYVGRMAFPIFAFQIAEGYVHTSNYKKYAKRLLIFALISEIPFDLFYGGNWIYPFHQNVLFTLLLGLMAIHQVDGIKDFKSIKKSVQSAIKLVGILLIALLGLVDYGVYGVLTVVAFYIFRDFKGARLCQLGAMIWMNVIAFKGEYIPLTVLGQCLEIPTQGFALFALIPIWLYNGKQGTRNKWSKYGAYLFYPVHILILYWMFSYL